MVSWIDGGMSENVHFAWRRLNFHRKSSALGKSPLNPWDSPEFGPCLSLGEAVEDFVKGHVAVMVSTPDEHFERSGKVGLDERRRYGIIVSVRSWDVPKAKDLYQDLEWSLVSVWGGFGQLLENWYEG